MIVFICLIIAVILFYVKQQNYRHSTYYRKTNNKVINVLFNKGRYGEYLTSRIIDKYALPSHKQLMNVYVPKKNSTEMTELDLIYIDRTGIYVIESKNYSGWIFGNEAQQSWTQTMPNKKKFKFYNPIRQNATHIRALQNFLGLSNEVFHSVIVFSERCQLKAIEVTSQNVHVLKRDDLKRFIQKQNKTAKQIFTQGEIDKIHKKLLPQMQVSETIKKQHIQTIKKKYAK